MKLFILIRKGSLHTMWGLVPFLLKLKNRRKKKEETCYFFNLKIRCGILQFFVGLRDKKKGKNGVK
jgi:hypothetical protein